ncbi:TPR Domain containing protein, partial [Aphelenchoides avenae]
MNVERIEEAAACFGKAARADPENWTNYERRIELLELLGMHPLAMKTRLQAAQSINCAASNVNFEWLQSLIKTVAEYFISLNDEDKAMEALETFILRSREFSRPADAQHLTLLGMWMNRGRYEDSAKSILALCPDVQPVKEDASPAIMVTFTHAGYTVKPFPPTYVHRFVVKDSLNTILLARLIVCLIRIGKKDFVPSLIDKLLERDVHADEEIWFLEVARAYHAVDSIPHGIKYIGRLLEMDAFKTNADTWFLYGLFQQARNNHDEAVKAYKRVLELSPGYVDARINLSSILQNLGRVEEALETLKDYDLDACAQLPDERLLVRQADVLLEQKQTEQYIRCLRMLLIPHFFVVHKQIATLMKSRRVATATSLSTAVKRAAMEAIRTSPLEKLVKRLGSVAFAEHRSTDELSGHQLHDYALKLVGALYEHGRYQDMLHVVCYSYLQPKILQL